MRIPTEKAMIENFGNENGSKLYKVLKTKDGWEQYQSANKYRLSCFHEPPTAMLRLEACNEILETHGIEGFAYEDYREGYSYCNAGDCYDVTLTYCSIDDKVRIESMADGVERAQENGWITESS